MPTTVLGHMLGASAGEKKTPQEWDRGEGKMLELGPFVIPRDVGIYECIEQLFGRCLQHLPSGGDSCHTHKRVEAQTTIIRGLKH
jgi:hypothetical protein